MSDDTWPDGEAPYEQDGDDGAAWLDGGDDSAYPSEPADIDTVDLQLADGDETDEPGAVADPDGSDPDLTDPEDPDGLDAVDGGDGGHHDALADAHHDGFADDGDHDELPAGGGDDLGEAHHDELAGGDDPDGPAEDAPWFAPDVADDPDLGADPDHDDLVDSDGWSADAFPPELDFADPPEPVDGLPWSDPAMLGDINDGLIDTDQTEYVTPDVTDLLDYSGADANASGGDVWAELLGSSDPATAGLARWWAPS